MNARKPDGKEPFLQGPFILDGTSYDPEGLRVHCRSLLKTGSLPTWKKEVLEFILQFLDRSSATILQHTSGTTGEPQPYYLKKQGMLNSARRTLEFFRPVKGSRTLLCLPVRYVAGKMVVVRALEGGLDLVTAAPSGDPLMGVEGFFSLCSLVPLQLYNALKKKVDLGNFEVILVGGGAVPETTRKELAGIRNTRVYESFAMTETCSHFALRKISGPDAEEPFTLLPGVGISSDPRGCLRVEMRGVTEQPVVTNDLVEIDRNGQQFRWKGRYDNLINSGGIKIRPEPLELKITEWIGRECLLVGESDPRLGERLVLVVEHPAEGAPVDQWLNLLKDRLKGVECPKRIHVLAVLPRNPSLKLDRMEVKRILKLV